MEPEEAYRIAEARLPNTPRLLAAFSPDVVHLFNSSRSRCQSCQLDILQRKNKIYRRMRERFFLGLACQETNKRWVTICLARTRNDTSCCCGCCRLLHVHERRAVGRVSAGTPYPRPTVLFLFLLFFWRNDVPASSGPLKYMQAG